MVGIQLDVGGGEVKGALVPDIMESGLYVVRVVRVPPGWGEAHVPVDSCYAASSSAHNHVVCVEEVMDFMYWVVVMSMVEYIRRF